MGDIVQEIEDAIQTAEKELPFAISSLSIFAPKLKDLMPYLDFLPLALQAVQKVQQLRGGSAAMAKAAVAAHLTSGMQNLDELGPGSSPSAT